MEFTYSAYRELLLNIKALGYAICDYHDYEGFERCVILRHDVDNSPQKALKFAELEKELDVKSTYFFLLSTDLYNAMSANTLGILHKIQELGHDIGLHFDETKYSIAEAEYDDAIRHYVLQEAEIFRKITLTRGGGITINSVSMHRPSRMCIERDLRIPGIVNAYSKTFFSEFKYLSDSRMAWREDVFAALESGDFDRLHILTHPFWYNEKEETMLDSLKNFVNAANLERYHALKENFRDLDAAMPISEVLR
jgi:hypothetical protein